MPSLRAMAMTGGALLIAIGLSLFLTMHPPLQLVGFLLGVFGIIILVYAFCQSMKSDHVAVPGHFLLHPRTGTRYSPHQAMAIQRRLDRIRRAAEEEGHQVRPVSTPPALLQHLSQQSLPRTPPPWEMEPPPSYETVMKGSQSPVQNS
ncbi:hypothetical protein AALO_G00123240 [Alosa alosa]|uniref:Bartter syndrome, infantile, with sensorineural deafness (Barttin) n=1 Tax=Alosa alosa TaxID=278164 RepID=A0AAV6GL62_9TELE|nr:uncharacterized protein si:dkeyp-51f12.3 [Alosa sapidissima]KAG5275670.1 hypothetical protein AALO_G00123240 [Alosa alosa]